MTHTIKHLRKNTGGNGFANGKCFANKKSFAYRKSFVGEKGFALVIALGLVALITIFALSISGIVLESLRGLTNIESSNEAYYAAEAGLEMGLLANKAKAAGFEDSNSINYNPLPFDEKIHNGATADWRIQGRATCTTAPCPTPPASVDYYTPRLSLSNAGDNCDPLREYDIDHSCNWGKLYVGESVAIPLYVQIKPTDLEEQSFDIVNDDILDPEELGFTSFTLKVRTPCENRSSSGDCGGGGESRHYLDDLQNDNGELETTSSDTIMLWQINGKCLRSGVTEDCYLTQNDYFDFTFLKDNVKNSEIYEKVINDGLSSNTFAVLNQDDSGIDNFAFDGTILAFLNNAPPSSAWNVSEYNKVWTWEGRDISRPVLDLSIIHSLIDKNTSNSIPYLEYQLIITSSNARIADIYQTVISEGFSVNFKQSLEMRQSQPTGVLKFVIQN